MDRAVGKITFVPRPLKVGAQWQVAAQTYETFADAILKKLITEIALNDR
jgi:hypothetical protein